MRDTWKTMICINYDRRRGEKGELATDLGQRKQVWVKMN